jgi:hypothetical protein
VHPDDSPEQTVTRVRPDGRSADPASAAPRPGRHRAVPAGRGGRALASGPVRITVATGVACCLGLAAFVGTRDGDTAQEPVREALADRAAAATEAEQRASRDRARVPSSPLPSRVPAPRPSVTRTAAQPGRAARPRPVAGLTQAQMENAALIVDTGVGLRIPRRGLVVAVATAMQESDLYNLASEVVPESLDHPHQGTGSDHDSVGLFQQRPSSGWGTVGQLMRPTYAARVFFEALRAVPGWQRMSITGAAQAVQISAFPHAYAKHEQRAATVVDALT